MPDGGTLSRSHRTFTSTRSHRPGPPRTRSAPSGAASGRTGRRAAGAVTGSPARASPRALGDPPDDRPLAHAGGLEIAQRDRTVSLRQPFAVGAEHERDVRVRGLRQPEQTLQVDLSRGGRHEIVAADDIVDPLGAVVDHDRQVVRRNAVVAPEHDVVDDALHVARRPDRRRRSDGRRCAGATRVGGRLHGGRPRRRRRDRGTCPDTSRAAGAVRRTTRRSRRGSPGGCSSTRTRARAREGRRSPRRRWRSGRSA